MNKVTNKTRVIVLISLIVILLIIGSIGSLFYIRKNQNKQEVVPPVAEKTEENVPVVPPQSKVEDQPPVSNTPTSPPAPNNKEPIKTPVSGPE